MSRSRQSLSRLGFSLGSCCLIWVSVWVLVVAVSSRSVLAVAVSSQSWRSLSCLGQGLGGRCLVSVSVLAVAVSSGSRSRSWQLLSCLGLGGLCLVWVKVWSLSCLGLGGRCLILVSVLDCHSRLFLVLILALTILVSSLTMQQIFMHRTT